jgi:hypothetical protein
MKGDMMGRARCSRRIDPRSTAYYGGQRKLVERIQIIIQYMNGTWKGLGWLQEPGPFEKVDRKEKDR